MPTVAQLKAMCTTRGLDTSGKKADLEARIAKDDAAKVVSAAPSSRLALRLAAVGSPSRILRRRSRQLRPPRRPRLLPRPPRPPASARPPRRPSRRPRRPPRTRFQPLPCRNGAPRLTARTRRTRSTPASVCVCVCVCVRAQGARPRILQGVQVLHPVLREAVSDEQSRLNSSPRDITHV